MQQGLTPWSILIESIAIVWLQYLNSCIALHLVLILGRTFPSNGRHGQVKASTFNPKRLWIRREAQKLKKAKLKKAKKRKKSKESSLKSKPSEPVVLLKCQLPSTIAMPWSKDSVLIINMMMPKSNLQCLNPSKKKTFVEL